MNPNNTPSPEFMALSETMASELIESAVTSIGTDHPRMTPETEHIINAMKTHIPVWRLTTRYSDGFRDTARFVEFFNHIPPLPELGSKKNGVEGWLVSAEAEDLSNASQ